MAFEMGNIILHLSQEWNMINSKGVMHRDSEGVPGDLAPAVIAKSPTTYEYYHYPALSPDETLNHTHYLSKTPNHLALVRLNNMTEV